VIGNKPLIEAVALAPRRVEELVEIKGFPGGLAREEGKDLLRRLNEVREMADSDLVPYPRGVRRNSGRPPQELEEVFDRLKTARNDAADAIGLPRGTLLANAVLVGIAKAASRNREELLTVPGMRRWKADVLGERLLEIVAKS